MAVLTAGDSEGLSLAGFGRMAFAIGIAAAHPSVITATSSLYEVSDGWWTVSKFYGTDLTYDAAGHLAGGVVTRWEAFGPTYENPSDAMLFSFAGLSVPATTVESWLVRRDGPESEGQILLLGGDDSIAGGVMGDYLVGFAGNDTIAAGAGDDFLQGGYSSIDGVDPSDPLRDGANVLRGGEGNDTIAGGAGFDDINGNQGNDVASGQNGGDWVLGGQGDDLLSGDAPYIREAGDDFVHGNLGNDTCSGDGGSDTVRGGQGDDVINGGAGDDWLSGDRGNDTLAGDSGADIFHSFGEAGVDRVTDFNFGEGDRVMLDAGNAYTVAQVGADAVISLGGGAQMILVGVQLSSVGDGWIIAG
jgi:serralysin